MTKGLLIFTVLSLLIFSGCFGSSGHSGIIAINASSPGSEVDLEKYVYPGKTTIVGLLCRLVRAMPADRSLSGKTS